ncbi:MAG: sensor histidine kinase [Candidatus Krumholzibacteriia bacterium]
MSAGGPPAGQRPRERYAVIVLMVVVISLLHYSTSFHLHGAHGIYRRLYYFPIIFAAFLGGWPAGLAAALGICALYAPHAFGLIGRDPAPTLEKALEMLLYVAVGLVSGVLVSRERQARDELQATAVGLERALREKAEMEAQLLRQARLAAVGRLSAGLAHEIRNPLASIQGAAELLADDFPAMHPKGRLVRVLTEEAARLNGVLTRFLAFARPQPGARAAVDLAAEARHVVELAAHREGAPRLAGPGPQESCRVTGDRAQLHQLLLNLVLNAGEAAGAGGAVAVRVARRDELVTLTVEDDGPGFTADALENFGTPFFSTRPAGTGLGLAICLRIAEDHGARIGAVNRETGGARVTVDFAAAPA